MSEPKTFAAVRVPIIYPAKRCVVCGDKIKGSGPDPETMIMLPGFYASGEDAYLEDFCKDEFETGLKHGLSSEPDAYRHGGKLFFVEAKTEG